MQLVVLSHVRGTAGVTHIPDDRPIRLVHDALIKFYYIDIHCVTMIISER